MDQGTYVMYHKEYAPKGREFDYADPSDPRPEELVQAGWADNPGKVGVNLLGERGRAGVERIQRDLETGKLTMLDDHDGAVERRQKEHEQAQQEYQRKIEGLESLKGDQDWRKRAEQGLEKEKDIHADVARKFPDAHGDPDATQTQVSGLPKAPPSIDPTNDEADEKAGTEL